MSTWTPAGKAELDRYFARLTPSLQATGADPAEVIDDLRQHLDREIAAEQLPVVTEADVRRLLARIGAPNTDEPVGDPPAASMGTGRSIGKFPIAAVCWLVERQDFRSREHRLHLRGQSRGPALGRLSWPRKSEQADKWSLCFPGA